MLNHVELLGRLAQASQDAAFPKQVSEHKEAHQGHGLR